MKNVPEHVHIFHVEDHEIHKKVLLDYIEEHIKVNNIVPNEKGYYYDFNMDPNIPRPYEMYLQNVAWSYLVDVGEIYSLKVQLKSLGRPWFQQYIQGSDFGWHNHDGHFGVIYYVELPEVKEATEFLDYGTFPVKEGDIIFFPTFLVHRSPIIESNLRKTILACNIKYEVDREYIKLNKPDEYAKMNTTIGISDQSLNNKE